MSSFLWIFLSFYWGGGRLRTSNFWLVGPLTLKFCHISYSGVWLTPDEEKAQRTRQTGWDTSASYCGLWGQPRSRGLMRTLSVRGSGIWVLPLALCQLQIFAYKISHTCIPQHFPSISLHSAAEWFLWSSVFNQRSMWAAFSRSFLLHTVNRLLNLALLWSLLTLQKRLNIFVCQRLCESGRTWLLWYKQSSRLGLHSL